MLSQEIGNVQLCLDLSRHILVRSEHSSIWTISDIISNQTI